MYVQGFRLFTFANDVVDLAFDNFIVGGSSDAFQFQASTMITRYDFIVDKPSEKEKLT